MRINSIYRSVIGQSIYNRFNSSHNPNVGLHPRAGQPAADEYNTRQASQSGVDTTQDRPVSQRWIQHRTGPSVKDGYNTRPARQSKMDTTQDRPVSQRWIQHKTSQSVKDGYNTQPASQ